MKNKIKDKIIQTTKRLIVRIVKRLVNSVTTTRANRAIHLNSAAAVHTWLAIVDQPCIRYKSIALVYEPPLGVDDPPLLCPFRYSDVTYSTMGAGGGRRDEESE